MRTIPTRAGTPALRRTAVASMLLLMAACSDDLGSTPSTRPADSVATVEIEPAALTLTTSESRQLQVKLRTADGAVLHDRPVTWESSDEAVVKVSAAGVITAETEGNAVVTASSGSVNGKVQITVASPAPVPVLAAIAPAIVIAEGDGFTLTLRGSGFTRNMWVRLEGAVLHPTFVSETELRVEVGAHLILHPGELAVRVLNLPPGGGYSGVLPLTVGPNPDAKPKPVLTSLSATTLAVGSGSQSLTLHGRDFVERSIVYVSGWERPTTFVDAYTLRVQLPAEDFERARDHFVWVVTRGPGGGSSDALLLRVRPASE